jgi:hypothetical protein
MPRFSAFLMLAGIAVAAIPALRRRPAGPPPGLIEAELKLWHMASPSKAVH